MRRASVGGLISLSLSAICTIGPMICRIVLVATRYRRRAVEHWRPEQDLDHANIDVLLQQMVGEAVPHDVRDTFLSIPAASCGGMAGSIELARRHRIDRVLTRKQPALGPRYAPPGAQQFEQLAESIALRSLWPLPCSMRMTIRLLSISETLRETTSAARRPAP